MGRKRTMTATPTLQYKIQKPKKSQKSYPAIFLLHGYGSNAEDLFSFAPFLPQNHVIISIQAPLALPQMGYAWYTIHFDAPQDQWTDLPQAKKALNLIFENCNTLIAKHQLDAKNISLIGFSQGAILSWAMAFNFPNTFKRIAALSGYINQDLIEKNEVTFSAFTSHGNADPVIPYQWAKNSITPLTEKYSTICFHSFDAGHTVSQENFIALLEWLNRHCP